jgi:HEAT repeat protein
MDLLSRMEGGAEVDDVIEDRLRQARAVEVRKDAIRILGDRRSAAAVDVLLGQARDEDPAIRVAALRAMRRTAGPKEVPALISLVEAETEDSVRIAAVPTLASACGDDGPSGELILAELKGASDPRDRDVWTRVVTAVGYSAALPTVLAGLDGEDPERVTWTVTRLGEWPDPAPVEPLLGVMDSSPFEDARRRACSAVIRLTTNAADLEQRPDDVLVGWFGRAQAAVETVEEKRQLVSGLARVPTLGSLRLLEPYLDDPEVRGEALYALLAIGSPLVKAGEHARVGQALPEASAIQDQELRWRIERLRQQVDAAQPSR